MGEDLQTEIEVLKEKGGDDEKDTVPSSKSEREELDSVLAVVNSAWEEEVTALIEQFRDNDIDVEQFRTNFSRKVQMASKGSADAQCCDECDYEAMYKEAVQSKVRLAEQSSVEIQRLRQIIRSQNSLPTVYRSVFDRIVRYHNLDGGEEDTIFQIMVDAGLKK